MSRELYELRVAEHGQEYVNTPFVRVKTALSNCKKANHAGEARELLTKFLATSKQVLGPHRNINKGFQLHLQRQRIDWSVIGPCRMKLSL